MGEKRLESPRRRVRRMTGRIRLAAYSFLPSCFSTRRSQGCAVSFNEACPVIGHRAPHGQNADTGEEEYTGLWLWGSIWPSRGRRRRPQDENEITAGTSNVSRL